MTVFKIQGVTCNSSGILEGVICTDNPIINYELVCNPKLKVLSTTSVNKSVVVQRLGYLAFTQETRVRFPATEQLYFLISSSWVTRVQFPATKQRNNFILISSPWVTRVRFPATEQLCFNFMPFTFRHVSNNDMPVQEPEISQTH